MVNTPSGEQNNQQILPDTLSSSLTNGESRMERDLNPIHNYPRLLFFKLDDRRRMLSQEYDLRLSIRFGKFEQDLPLWGKVIIGLKGGKLNITITNGKIPADSIYPNQSFEPIPIEQKREKSRKIQSTGEATLGTFKASLGGEASEVASQTRKFSAQEISVYGDEVTTVWDFSCARSENLDGSLPVFKGQYTIDTLGTVRVESSPCYLEAKFKATIDQMTVVEAKGLYSSDMDRKRWITLDRMLVQYYLGSMFEDCLSQIKKCL